VAGTVLGAQTAGRALIGINVSWPDRNLGGKSPGLTFQGEEIGIAENLDIGRPTGLN